MNFRPAALCACILLLTWALGRLPSLSKKGEIPPKKGGYYVYFTDPPAQNPLSSSIPNAYLDSLFSRGISLRYELYWLNAVSIEASPSEVAALKKLHFVQEIHPFSHQTHTANQEIPQPTLPKEKWDSLLVAQRSLLGYDHLEQQGLGGKGITIAVLDAGFSGLDTHAGFQHLHDRNAILATWDFYDQDEQVFHHSPHGTQVMGCLAGKYKDTYIGVAPEANFLLARTEHRFKEKPIEEDHWIAAAQWAAEHGADIINTSVIFTSKFYQPDDMDGKSAPVSRAAAIAVQKGILVVSAMGNEGSNTWRIMGAPADAPEVLSVGGSIPILPMYSPFASQGPNAVGQLKPDIAAPAYVLTTTKHHFAIRSGTSYASPLIAGLAACLLQADPSQSPLALKNKIHRMGHFYPYYDYYLGYGVPHAGKMDEKGLKAAKDASYSVRIADTQIEISLNKLPESKSDKLIYFHLALPDGRLQEAFYDLVSSADFPYQIPWDSEKKGILRIWMDGHLYEHRL